MKKLLSILAILLAFIGAQAQVTIILEAHNVWGEDDYSGYQLLLDADHTAFGSIIPETGPLSTSGDVDASVYAEFEYKVPEDADGSLTTSNMVFDGSVEITIPAGTYDYCITNPTPGDRMWIAAGDNGRKDDYVFEDGKIYHFTVTLNESTGNDQVSIEIVNAGESTITSRVETMNFTALAGESAIQETTINLYNLTSATATTAAPFSVSTDGSNFSTTATISASGTTLYVKFEATSTTTSNGTVTLVGDDAETTITLIGTVIDCGSPITNFPYSTSFAYDDASIACWQLIDANDDATEEGGTFFLDDNAVAYYFSSENDADDWLISPAFLGTNLSASIDYKVKSSYYDEIFGIYIIPEGEGVTEAIEVVAPMTVSNSTYATLPIDLSAYDDQAIRIAIHVTSEADQWAIYFTNFIVNGDSPVTNTYEITATANPAEGGTIEGADTYEEGATATLIATANEGFTFTCWTKDGDTVSNEATYTFTVTASAEFVANFERTDGIYEVAASNISIYNYDNQIVVKNAEGLSVAIYDINGRLIVNESKVSQSECRYTVSTSGIYLVRVGESVVRKVAVLNR